MSQTLEHRVDVAITTDDGGAHDVFHCDPIACHASTPQQAAADYLRSHAALIRLPGAGGAAGSGPYGLCFEAEHTLFDTVTVSYEQTYDGIAVWRRGAAVQLHTEPLRVVRARSTARDDILVRRPSQTSMLDRLTADADDVVDTLGLTADALSYTRSTAESRSVTVLKRRTVIFRYDEATRVRPSAQGAVLPSPVPAAIRDGADRVAVETTVQVGVGPHSLAWLVLSDVETGTVLYVEPFVAPSWP